MSDEQVSVYGRLPESLSRSDLERFFFLDDVDRRAVESKRRDHNKLGFALQLVTVRNAGAFLDDPLDVPFELVEYLAEQLGIADASCVKSYGEREKTRFEHVELRRDGAWREFSVVEEEIGAWVEDRAWTTGDGPKALFDAAAAWRSVLVKRFATVRPFLPLLCEVIRFGATPDGERVLKALRALPKLWGGCRNKVARTEIDERLLIGSWRRLVLRTPELEPAAIDWRAWTFCVLEQFHRCLRGRDETGGAVQPRAPAGSRRASRRAC